jgi:tetratricopeptide (TPR) repeat protein
MPRLDKLLSLLEKSPGDAFLLYGTALEYKNEGDFRQAISYLDRCIAADGSYCYAYYQKGACLEQLGETESAAATYRTGIKAARAAGDAKAEGELSQALAIVE